MTKKETHYYAKKMKLILLKRLGKSLLRIIAALAIVFGVLAGGYWLW